MVLIELFKVTFIQILNVDDFFHFNIEVGFSTGVASSVMIASHVAMRWSGTQHIFGGV